MALAKLGLQSPTYHAHLEVLPGNGSQLECLCLVPGIIPLT